MGTSKLTKFLKIYAEKKTFTDFKGYSMPVDGNYQLYKYGVAIRSDGRDMVNKDGKIINHLHAVFTYSMFLINHGIIPIYVFDRKAPKIKQNTIQERKNKKNLSIQKCTEILDKDSTEYVKNFKQSYSITTTDIDECVELLGYMGIPCVHAIGEADPQCAALTYKNDIYGVITEDIDVLVLGAKKILKGFSGKNTDVQQYSLDVILENLTKKAKNVLAQNTAEVVDNFTFDRDNLIEYAILLGTDYTPHIKCSHDSLLHDFEENIFSTYVKNNMNVKKTISALSEIPLYEIPKDFLEKFKDAKDYFTSVTIIKNDKVNTNLSEPNKSKVIDFMCKKNKFDATKIKTDVDTLSNMYNVITKYNNRRDDIKFTSFRNYQWTYYYNIYNKQKNAIVSTKSNSCSFGNRFSFKSSKIAQNYNDKNNRFQCLSD